MNSLLLVAGYYFFVSILSAYLSLKVKDGSFPYWSTLLGSVCMATGWMTSVRLVKIPMLNLGALIDVAATVGLYFGLWLFGEPVKTIQFFGIAFVIAGLYLINK